MRFLCVILFVLLCGLVACSGPKQLASPSAEVKSDSTAKPLARNAYPPMIDSAQLLRLEIAHGSFLRALALENAGEFEMAEEFMRHAYDADPENRYLAFSLLELMSRRGAETSEDALKLVERAKSLKGKRTSSQYALLGKIYSEMSLLDSALFYYKKAVEASDQNLYAAYEYSRLLEVTHNTEELIRVYGALLPQLSYPSSMLERQVSLLAETKNDSVLADLLGDVYEARGDRVFLENRIRLLFGMKRFEEALLAIDEFRADSAYTDDSLSVTLLTAAYFGLKKDSVALDSLKEIYKRHLDRGDVLMNLALTEIRLGKKEQAKVHMERLAQMEKYAASALGMLSSFALEAGDSTKSLEYLEKAYAKDTAAYQNTLISYYSFFNRYEKAYKVLDKALEPDPDVELLREKAEESGNLGLLRQFNAQVARTVANFHIQYGDILQSHAATLETPSATKARADSARDLRQKASWHYREAIRIGGTAQALLFAYGANFLVLGEVDSSITVFKKLFQDFPDDATAKNHLGYSLVDLNRSAEEVKWGTSLIDEALAKEPNELAFKDSKAWALYRAGKFREALSLMEEVESKQDSFPEMFSQDTSIFAHLAAICEALSLNERAIGYYQKVLNIDPQNANAKKRIEALKGKDE